MRHKFVVWLDLFSAIILKGFFNILLLSFSKIKTINLNSLFNDLQYSFFRSFYSLNSRIWNQIQNGTIALTKTRSKWEDVWERAMKVKAANKIVWMNLKQNSWTVRVRFEKNSNLLIRIVQFNQVSQLRRIVLMVVRVQIINVMRRQRLRLLELQLLPPQTHLRWQWKWRALRLLCRQ